MKKIIPSIFFIFLFIYTFAICFLYVFQNNFIYFPDYNSNINNLIWNKVYVNNTIVGLRSKSNFNKNIIIFHGNAGNVNSRSYFIKIFPNANVILFEYPGYSFRKNEEISKKIIINSAIEFVKLIQKENKEIVIVGESLGTGVASEVANTLNLEKLILITPYDSILNIAKDKLPFFPISLILNNNFDNIKQLSNYHGKVIFLIAENDEVINFKYSNNLINSLNSQKINIIYLKNSKHNNYYDYLNLNEINSLNNL